MLLVDDVPSLQPTISPAHEEDTWPQSTPAAISQQLSARVNADERAVQHIICPHPSAPVSNGEEVLAEGRVPLQSSDRTMMTLELVDDHLWLILCFLGAAKNPPFLSANHVSCRNGRVIL